MLISDLRLARGEGYLVLVVFQGIVPFDEIKEGEGREEWIHDEPLSQLCCVSRSLICLDIKDI